MRADGAWEQQYGHAGRTVRGGEAAARAREWAKLAERDKLLRHPAAADFLHLLPQARLVGGSSFTCFRGRPFYGGKMPSGAGEMGPPPLHGVPNEGRYNRAGEHVLYLSDSKGGVYRELRQEKGLLYVQKYQLPLEKLRIADFTRIPPDHLVTAIFAQAELCKVEGRGGPESYIFSQTVAELVAKHFDGMRMLGVHGEPWARYSNVVIFKPHDPKEVWQSWLESGATPFWLMQVDY